MGGEEGIAQTSKETSSSSCQTSGERNAVSICCECLWEKFIIIAISSLYIFFTSANCVLGNETHSLVAVIIVYRHT
jgi:hypothetical protein